MRVPDKGKIPKHAPAYLVGCAAYVFEIWLHDYIAYEYRYTGTPPN